MSQPDAAQIIANLQRFGFLAPGQKSKTTDKPTGIPEGSQNAERTDPETPIDHVVPPADLDMHGTSAQFSSREL